MQLYEFQNQYLSNLPRKYIFAADTGTGKTVMALAHYDRRAPVFEFTQHAPNENWRNAEYQKKIIRLPLLILAPASKVRTGDWEREITEYFGVGNEPKFEIYSYEKFSRKPTLAQRQKTGAIPVWQEWLNKYPDGFAMIVDEVHKAKNPQSGIGRAVFEVSKSADFFVGLSATPLPNGWIDAANYYKIFGYVKNITDFKKRYCNIQTFKGFPEIVGYWRENELQRFWNGIAKPLSKQEALDLPPTTIVPVSLEAGKQYFKVQKERMFADRFLDNPSALMHALRQSLIEPKVAWLNDFLEGVSDNVVIFYNYIEEREQILAMIKKSHKGRTVFRQDGEKHEVPDKSKWAGLNRTITLAQYQSGSTGIELTYAATTVYFSPTYSYSNYEQSIGRTNRNGQTSKMTLYLLCAPTTLERDVWSALRDKTDFQEKQWYTKQLKVA